MPHRSELGKIGENLATDYLKRQRYKILERNYRQPWGEIDIIARSPDKTLVFVEVKAVKGLGITPEEHLTKSKLKILERTASLYTGQHPQLVKDNKGWRIDLIAISFNPGHTPTSMNIGSGGLTDSLKDFVIKHYENI
ncbi:MAG: YraN family protein [Candidatus Colwellbacteria bacterium]|nr:YraN family protein [Candidatus Colwellbacteria bacterium]